LREATIVDPQAEVIGATNAGVVVGLRWRETSPPATRELFQVLRLRGGKVVDMQDHADRRAALKAVGAA
jgi:hypothetical protein